MIKLPNEHLLALYQKADVKAFDAFFKRNHRLVFGYLLLALRRRGEAEAALRETREETGWDVRLTAFVGAYQWKAPSDNGGSGRHYLRFAFAAEPVHHDPARKLDEGIVRALWMTPAELREQQGRHRSPLVWQVVVDYLAGRRQPLETLQHIA